MRSCRSNLTAESGNPVEGPDCGPLQPRWPQVAVLFPGSFAGGNQAAAAGPGLPGPASDQGRPSFSKRSSERNAYGNLIVMAEHTVGRGRVLFLGTDTLWKWHTLAENNDGPTPYSLFWQQAFRAMTPVRSNLGSVNLWLTASQSRTETGRKVVLQAEVQGGQAASQVQLPGHGRLAG